MVTVLLKYIAIRCFYALAYNRQVPRLGATLQILHINLTTMQISDTMRVDDGKLHSILFGVALLRDHYDWKISFVGWLQLVLHCQPAIFYRALSLAV